jgi:hypothetical protein
LSTSNTGPVKLAPDTMYVEPPCEQGVASTDRT